MLTEDEKTILDNLDRLVFNQVKIQEDLDSDCIAIIWGIPNKEKEE